MDLFGKIVRGSLLLVFLIFSTACNNSKESNEPKTLNINVNCKEEPNFIVEIDEIIPLQTYSNNLIGIISVAEFYHNRFYIMDLLSSKALLVYDEKGKFIKKTSLGKGPGEVISPRAFTINREENLIYVHDQIARRNLIYDLDLNYINNGSKNPFVFIMNFSYINRDTFLVYHNVPIDKTDPNSGYNSYMLYTDDFKKEKLLGTVLNQNKGTIELFKPISIFKDEVLFVEPYNYNIYQLIGNKTIERYRINFRDKNLTNGELENFSWSNIQEDEDLGKHVGLIYGIFKTDEFFVIRLYLNKTRKFFFYSFSTGKSYCLNSLFSLGVIPECQIMGTLEDGRFFCVVESEKFIDYQKSSGKYDNMDIQINDNPIMMFLNITNPEK